MSIRTVVPSMGLMLLLAIALAGCIAQETIVAASGSAEKHISFKGGNKVVISPDGTHMVTVNTPLSAMSSSYNATLYNIESGKLIRTFSFNGSSMSQDKPTNGTFAAAFNSDGSLLATGGGSYMHPDGVDRGKTYWPVAVWDVATGRRLYTLRTYLYDIHAITFTPDGKSIAFVSNNAIRIWDYKSFKEPDSIPFNYDYYHDARAMQYSPDGRHLLLSPFGIIDVAARTVEVVERSYLNDAGRAVVINADGTRIFGCGGASVASIDATTFENLGRIEEWEKGKPLDELRYTTIDADRTGTYFVTGDDWGRVRVWRASNGEMIADVNGETGIHSVQFTRDGRSIVAADKFGTITVWRLHD